MELLKYKVEPHGGRVIEVPAAYSSQECWGCGHIASENRRSQHQFECVACGHRANADGNAARVILQRGMRAAEGCGGDATRRPAKQQLRAVRRGTRSKSSEALLRQKASGFSPG